MPLFGTLALVTAREQKGWYPRVLTLRTRGNCLLRDNNNLIEINSFCRPGWVWTFPSVPGLPEKTRKLQSMVLASGLLCSLNAPHLKPLCVSSFHPKYIILELEVLSLSKVSLHAHKAPSPLLSCPAVLASSRFHFSSQACHESDHFFSMLGPGRGASLCIPKVPPTQETHCMG